MSRILGVIELKRKMGFKEVPHCCGNCLNCNKWGTNLIQIVQPPLPLLPGEFRTTPCVCNHWKSDKEIPPIEW